MTDELDQQPRFWRPREEWPEGPWRTEPDREDFRHAGLPCFVLRNKWGAWCGYAGVTPDHPAYGKRYDARLLASVEVHGGITYAEKCNPPICHVPSPGETDDIWWFGFDCSHLGDYQPGEPVYANGYEGRRADYKTLEYARRETCRLAEQLEKMAGAS